MSHEPARTARLASWVLPARDREIILADLWEDSAGERRRGRWVAREAVRMAMHFHLECYRDPGEAARLLALLLCGAGLLTTIHAIGLGPMDGARFFADPITRAILAFWSASHITSALAAGLVTGRMTLAPHLSVARWHMVALLAAMLVAQHGPALGTIGAAVLAGSAALADRARRAAGDTANRPTLAPR